MKTSLLCFALGLALQSCAASQAFVVAGDAIDDVGRKFILTSEVMRDGFSRGEVTIEAFQRWVAFADVFDRTYGLTVDAYHRAVRVKDQAEAGRLLDVIAALVKELAGFYGTLKQAHLLPAGAP